MTLYRSAASAADSLPRLTPHAHSSYSDVVALNVGAFVDIH